MIEKIRSKDIKICIVGLGYVGLPLALSFAEKNIEVIGFDIDKKHCNDLNNGISKIDTVSKVDLAHSNRYGVFKATSKEEDISGCDVYIIAVPTPTNKRHEPNLEYIKVAAIIVGNAITKKNTLVILESTVYPGCTKKVLVPRLIKWTGVKKILVAFSPEREDPGNKKYNTRNIPKIVGGIDKESLETACALYSLALDEVVPVSSIEVAEASKLLENAFRLVNISFVNELKQVFRKMNIDIWEVIKVASTKPFGFMPFYPGPGIGGHCIPVDPYYLSWKAKEYDVATKMIDLANEVNEKMPEYITQEILNQGVAYYSTNRNLHSGKILIVGIAYKPNISDIRESPAIKIINLLAKKSIRVDCYDPYVSDCKEINANAYILSTLNYDTIRNEYDITVILTKHKDINYASLYRNSNMIFDTVGAMNEIEDIYYKVTKI